MKSLLRFFAMLAMGAMLLAPVACQDMGTDDREPAPVTPAPDDTTTDTAPPAEQTADEAIETADEATETAEEAIQDIEDRN